MEVDGVFMVALFGFVTKSIFNIYNNKSQENVIISKFVLYLRLLYNAGCLN